MDVPSGSNVVSAEESVTRLREKIKLVRRALKKMDSNLATQKENIDIGRFISTAMETAPIDGPTEPKRMKSVASKSTQTMTDETSDYVMAIEKILSEANELLDGITDLHFQVRNKLLQDKLNLLDVIDAFTELLE